MCFKRLVITEQYKQQVTGQKTDERVHIFGFVQTTEQHPSPITSV
jgi:hypothetical protein